MIIGLLGVKGAGKDTAGAVLARELNGTCLAFADPMKRFCHNALGLTERQLWGDAKEKPINKKQLKCANPPEPPTQEVVWIGHGYPRLSLPWMHALDLAIYEPIGFPIGPSSENPRHAANHAMAHWWAEMLKRKRVTPRVVLQTFGTEVGRQQLGDDIWVRQGLAAARKVLDGWAYDRVQGLAKRHGGSDAAIITDVRFRNEVLAIKRAGGKIVRINRETKGGDRHASEAEQASIPDFWCDAVITNQSTKKDFEMNISQLAGAFRTGYFV